MKRTAGLAERYGPAAVVAGASQGLGAAFSEALAAAGFDLLLVARREKKLRLLGDRLEDEYAIRVTCLAADLAAPETARIIASVHDRGQVGLLVYNAAYAPAGPFAAIPVERLRQVAEVNVRTPIDLVHALLPGLRSRDRSGIVLMSSLAGGQGAPGIAVYGASKAFTTVLAEGLWHELREDGVDVTACVAGAVRTPGFEQVMGTGGSNRVPGTLDAAKVAATALRALGRTPVVVPGVVNKLAWLFMRRMLPVKTAVPIMASSTKRLSSADEVG